MTRRGCVALSGPADPSPAAATVRFKSRGYISHKQLVDDSEVQIVDGHVSTSDPIIIAMLRRHPDFEEVK